MKLTDLHASLATCLNGGALVSLNGLEVKLHHLQLCKDRFTSDRLPPNYVFKKLQERYGPGKNREIKELQEN